MKRLEAQHVFGEALDEAMILLKDVIEIFDLKNLNHLACVRDFQDYVYSLSTGQIGPAFINDDLIRNTIAAIAFLKKRLAEPRFRRSDSMNSSVWPSRSTAQY